MIGVKYRGFDRLLNDVDKLLAGEKIYIILLFLFLMLL